MLLTGLRLMVIGMAVVFFFLTTLVMVLKAVSAILKTLARHLPEEKPDQEGRDRPAADNTDREIAIALAAVRGYKETYTR